jgi:hypothetical protein
MTRALIMAGGTDEKWTKLGGEGRRHFAVICGERVIDRLIRQLRERGITDIGIISPPDIAEYDIEGTFRVRPTHAEHTAEALNGRHYWHEQARTLMVYGDTVFTDRAMDLVAGNEPHLFRMFGRYDKGFPREPYRIKGGGGELFAFSFWPEQRDSWAAAVTESFALRDAGIIKRGGSWEGYRIMGGARGRKVGRHALYSRVFSNIRDETDDFDTPEQLVKLRALFEGDSHLLTA